MKKVLLNILYIESWYWNRSLIILKWGSFRSHLKSFRETIDVSNIIRREFHTQRWEVAGGGRGSPDFKRQGWSNGGKYKNPKKSLGLQTKPPKNLGQKFNPPMSDVWCQMSDVRCPMSMSDVKFPMSHVRCLMSCVGCPIYSTSNVWCPMSDLLCLIYDVRCPTSWCLIFDVRCLIFVCRYPTSDVRFLMSDVGCLVWCLNCFWVWSFMLMKLKQK